MIDSQPVAIQGSIGGRAFDNTDVTGNGAAIIAAMAALEGEVATDPTASMPSLRAMLYADTQDHLFIVPLPSKRYLQVFSLLVAWVASHAFADAKTLGITNI